MNATKPLLPRVGMASLMRGLRAVWDFPALAWRCAVVTGLHSVHSYVDLVDGSSDRRAGASS